MSGIRCFLCSRVALRHLSVGAHLAARRLSQCLGWQELAALKHHATCFQALLGCSLCLPTLPFRLWRGITFCNEQAHRIVILNTGWNCAELSKQKMQLSKAAFFCLLMNSYPLTFGSSRPRPFFLSTTFSMKPIMSAATPRLANIISGAV